MISPLLSVAWRSTTCESPSVWGLGFLDDELLALEVNVVHLCNGLDCTFVLLERDEGINTLHLNVTDGAKLVKIAAEVVGCAGASDLGDVDFLKGVSVILDMITLLAAASGMRIHVLFVVSSLRGIFLARGGASAALVAGRILLHAVLRVVVVKVVFDDFRLLLLVLLIFGVCGNLSLRFSTTVLDASFGRHLMIFYI